MRIPCLVAALMVFSVMLRAEEPAAPVNGNLLYPKPGAAESPWQTIGEGADGITYMLWDFNRNWTGRRALALNVHVDEPCTVSVAVADEWDTYAVHTEAVIAGDAKIVVPMSEIVRDGMQLPFMKKIAVWARRDGNPAAMRVDRAELVGYADTASMPRNWMTLCDGETAYSESMWEPFRSGRVRASEEHATQGKRSIGVTFRGEHWSSVYGFIQPDWRGYERLVLDAFNPTAETLSLRIAFRPTWSAEHKGVEASHVAELKPGANHVVCDMSAMIDEAQRVSGRPFDLSVIQNVPFILVGNSKTLTLHFDDMHLEGPGAKRPGAVGAFVKRSHEAEWYRAHGMKDDLFVSKPLSADEVSGETPVVLPAFEHMAGRLFAGVAKIDISPEPGSRGMLSHLYARAVVLADGRTQAAFVVIDWMASYGPVADVAAETAAKLTGIPKENIFIWSTHNHSGPSAWGPIGEKGYKKDAVGWIASAVFRARQNMQPVRVRGAKTEVDLNFNRRLILPDGSGGGFLWHRYTEVHWDAGFVDREMGLVTLEGDDGRPVASLVMYSGHANMNCVIDRTYNADYPGVACATLERETGAPALFINGSFGNVDMKGNAQSLERTVHTGLAVARAVRNLRAQLIPLAAAPIHCGSRWRDAAPWKDKPANAIGVGALVFGDVAFAQPQGELYTEFSREIKQASPFTFTFTAFWRGGYLPTRKAVAEGGYGADRAPDWGELSRDLLVELLKSFRPDKPAVEGARP